MNPSPHDMPGWLIIACVHSFLRWSEYEENCTSYALSCEVSKTHHENMKNALLGPDPILSKSYSWRDLLIITFVRRYSSLRRTLVW
jgi:hypothetical protein